MKIHPAKYLKGEVRVPGDKSISHRAVMLASLAEGVTRITNFAPGEDCTSTVRCMQQLGVRIDREGTAVTVHGVGKYGLKKPDAPLDCGNSGTTMRLLAGILAGQPFDTTLIGDESLSGRPMNRIIEPLRQMGGNIGSDGGRPPLKIHGVRLKGIEYSMPVASAQVKSCILLAGLYADGGTTVVENAITRDHTERMLRSFGVQVAVCDGPIRRPGPHTVRNSDLLTARDLDVPGDISSAMYFLVAAACLSGSSITLPNVGVNPTRFSVIVEALVRAGVGLETGTPTSDTELAVSLAIVSDLAPGEPITLSRLAIPFIIDEIPILAVLGTQLEHGLTIRDAAELRVKESDRISSVVDNLTKMGADVTEFDDGFRVERSQLGGAVIDSRGDHRIAMAFAVAGLLAESSTEISGAEAARVSYPAFFDDLEALSVR